MRVLATAQGQQHLTLVDQQIEALVEAMERLGVVFPVSGTSPSFSLARRSMS